MYADYNNYDVVVCGLQQIVTYSPRVKTGALLPEFPTVTDIILTDDISEDKVYVATMTNGN